MSVAISGIHHVTMIGGPPNENLAFWSSLLGLRLVKRTVNFDDPAGYHLYYGDARGNPGTLLTFFPHQSARRRAAGAPEVGRVVLGIPAGAAAWWAERLRDQRPERDERGLFFDAPDGTRSCSKNTGAPGARRIGRKDRCLQKPLFNTSGERISEAWHRRKRAPFS